MTDATRSAGGRRRRARAALAVGAALAAAGGLGAAVAASGDGGGPAPTLPRATRAGQQTFFGHVRAIHRVAGRHVMRFDPALFLQGRAAERAAVEDGAIPPGAPVPNDVYVVDETPRTLSYPVARDARVTVLTRTGAGSPPRTRISVAEFAAIVAGRNPRHRDLLEPAAGVWIRIAARDPNPVLTIDQQYQP